MNLPAYSNAYLLGVLGSVHSIAMVGASATWNRPSHFAMKYLQEKGYRVIPVNPGQAGKEILGELCYASLAEVPGPYEMVDIFRSSDAALGVVEEAIALKNEKGIAVIWMQLGVINHEAAGAAEAAGLKVVMDRCPKIEFGRLNSELSWGGFNSRIISARRKKVGAVMKRELPEEFGFETRMIHAGAQPEPITGARQTPIYQNIGYSFHDVDNAASLFNLQTFGFIYSRLTNPTVAVLEERVANLEGGRGATGCSSGHAAQILALFPLMEPGDHVVASNKLYGGSITQFTKTFKKFGWQGELVDADDPENVRRAITARTKAIFCESLANPGGVINDLEALGDIARAAGIPLIVDNTMATPYLCRPIEWGADLVVHSTTKFLSGNGTSQGGAVVDSGRFDWSQNDKFASLAQPEAAYHGLTFAETFGDMAYTTYSHAVSLRDLGMTMAPMNAFQTLLGIETLSLRMERHCENALKLAAFLESDDRVAWVSYAGLPGNPYGALADKYLGGKAGSVFTFGVKGGYEAGIRLVEACELFSHLANLGDARSLILHPASTTHRQLSPEQLEAAGAGPDVIRLSVGLESIGDLIADLDQALSKGAG